MFMTVEQDMWLLWGKGNPQEDGHFQKEVFGFLLKIFKGVQGAFKSNEKQLIPV